MILLHDILVTTGQGQSRQAKSRLRGAPPATSSASTTPSLPVEEKGQEVKANLQFSTAQKLQNPRRPGARLGFRYGWRQTPVKGRPLTRAPVREAPSERSEAEKLLAQCPS